MNDGPCAFDAAFRAPPTQPGRRVVAPDINNGFIRELLSTMSAHVFRMGNATLADYFEKNLAEAAPLEIIYGETALAGLPKVELRLIAQGCPMLSQPRVVRLAGFTGMGIIELDFHGQQLLKYARRHQLPHSKLQLAYGSTEAIKAFRQRP